jgi:hypothetical protein
METPDDMPWTEEEWELHLRRDDVQSARLMDLLHTFLDHPDLHRIIDKEMGWTHRPPPGRAGAEVGVGAGAEPQLERGGIGTAVGGALSEGSLASIPCYAQVRELPGMITAAILRSVGKDEADVDMDELFYWLDRMQGHTVSTMMELQEAHQLGESPHLLTGKIVHYRRALHEIKGLRRMLEDCADEVLTRDPLDLLLQDVLRLEAALTSMVAALRARVPS